MLSPRQVAVVTLGVIACSHSVRLSGVTFSRPSGNSEGAGTFVMRKGVPLRYLEIELLRVSGRPDADECALLFRSCPNGPASYQFLVTTPPPEQARGCMEPFCGERIDDLLKASWGRDVPRIMFGPTGIQIIGREGEFRESTIEAAIEKLVSGKDRPGLVIIEANCPDPVGPKLRAIELLNQANIRALLTMFRHHPSERCEEARFLVGPDLE